MTDDELKEAQKVFEEIARPVGLMHAYWEFIDIIREHTEGRKILGRPGPYKPVCTREQVVEQVQRELEAIKIKRERNNGQE